MKRTIIIIVSFIILLGAIGVSLNLALGNQTVVYLTKIRMDNGQFIYKFNFANYLMNITTNVSDTSKLALALPSREWQWMTTITNWEPLGNDLALILDYIIFIINIIIYPFRIGAYLLRSLLTLVGINTDVNNNYNGLAWLIELVNWMVERIQIPYI